MQLHLGNRAEVMKSCGNLCEFGRMNTPCRKLNNHCVNGILKAILEMKQRVSLTIPNQDFQTVSFQNLILKTRKTQQTKAVVEAQPSPFPSTAPPGPGLENTTSSGQSPRGGIAGVTTIGFGDITAVTDLGRTISVVLGIYGIIVVALITSIIVNFYGEIKKARTEEEAEAENTDPE